MNGFTNKICVAHLNVRSLLPKLADIQQMLSDFNIDVLCLTETWLTNAVDNSMIKIEGYNIHRNDREVRCGGGVAIYVRSYFKCSVIESSPIIEQIWISIRFLSLRILALVVCIDRRILMAMSSSMQ